MKKTRFQKKKTSSLKRKIFGGLFFCLLAGLAYFFIWSPVLWIEKIEFKEEFRGCPSDTVLKSRTVSEGQSLNVLSLIVQNNLEEKLWQFIPRKSIILAPHDKIKEDILESFPEIKAVVVNKKLPRLGALASLTKTAEATIEIIIEKRKSIGIWCQIKEENVIASEHNERNNSQENNEIMEPVPSEAGDLSAASGNDNLTEPKITKCFYIDKEGIVFKESPLISGSLVLNIFSSKKQLVDLRNEVVSPEAIDFILTINKELPKIKTVTGPSWQILDFKIISPEDLRVRTTQGCQIYFNPTYSVDSQLKALEMALEKEIKENWPSLEYIDLRIEGRVYYR